MGFLFGSGKTQSNTQPALSGVQFQTSVYGKCIPIVFGTNRIAPNVIWYGDFVATATPAPSGGGGKGGIVGGGTGKGGGGTSGYTYSTSVSLGLCEGPIVGIGNVYIDKNVTTAAAQGFTTFLGTYPQTPWTYLTTNHPTEALGYNGISHMDVAALSLGNSANLPNHNFEIRGIYSNSVGSLPDADPSLVITALLTDAKFGAGFPSSKLGDMTTYQAYTLAAGLLISPAYSTQQQSSQMIDDIAKNTNSAAVWSSGVLTFIPYGDTTISGNGKTYTPPSSPQYDLTDDDFMPQANADPVQMTRKRQSDSINSLKMEYSDSTINYNTAMIEVKDQTSIDLYGLRQDSSNNSHLFCNAQAAQSSAQLQLNRQSIRNIYQFTLDQRYIRLDPMDIVTLTDSNLGLNQQWVRILTIDEQADYSLQMTAEEYLSGIGSPAINSFAVGSGYNTNYNIDPGLANTPIIFEIPIQMARNTSLETWMAVSGGANWGGCDVYISSDNAVYQFIGTIQGQCRMGFLAATLATGVDPDVTNTLFVDVSESFAELNSGTIADADAGNTMCYVDGELIAYETATLTSAYNYSLTYLRRGFYGTTIQQHRSGTNFARLDNQIFTHPYTPDQIGKTVYIKLCGFNLYGGGRQSLADVITYPHTIVGPPLPANVENFTARQVEASVVFSWDNVDDFALRGYDIRYAPQGTTNWNSFHMITEASKTTEMTTADVPPGTWVFAIRAVDIAGQLSPLMTTYNLIVFNLQPVITMQEQSPDWPGTLSGFVRHWSGVLVPEDVNPASFYGWELFDTMVPNPVALSTYITPTFDIGYEDNLRIWYTYHLTEGIGEAGSPTADIYLDDWLTGTDPFVYTLWTLGFISFRYMNMKLSYAAVAGSVAFVDEFQFTIDTGPILEDLPTTIVVSPGGTAVTFTSNFRDIPYVSAPVIGNSALYSSVESPSTTGAIIHVWDHSGSDVGGTVTYTARGP